MEKDMAEKRAVEHYKKHEIVAVTTPDAKGWRFKLTVVKHDGDDSEAIHEEAGGGFESDLAALHAAKVKGRDVVDRDFDASE